MKRSFILFSLVGLISCKELTPTTPSLSEILKNQPSIPGKADYLKTPYVTAGDRLYAVGNQDGSFADIGWHVPGEMGGIWDHPIKLMDGFELGFSTGDRFYALNNARQFLNYPYTNQHLFSTEAGIEVIRTQFVPDGLEGLIIEYVLDNKSTVSYDLVLEFTGKVDLRPVWLAEKKNITNGADLPQFDQESQAWTAKDSLNDWHVIFGADYTIDGWKNPTSLMPPDNSTILVLTSDLYLKQGERKTIKYFIAGSYQSGKSARATYNQIKNTPSELLQEKMDRYQSIRSTAMLKVPDKDIEKMYTWTKYATDWLIRDVPEIGRGLSAGIPDYPWWFGTDNAYSLQGWLATGQHEEVKQTIQLILNLSKQVNDNGRIMHEASTNGVVFNPGNLNTTPYFIHLLWKYYQWTGDRAFIESLYPDIKKGIAWTESMDKDGNGYPDGAGMMEIHGLHTEMIDVVVYLQAAYKAAANMANQLGFEEDQKSYAEKAAQLKRRINEEWWVESANSFADFRANRSQTIQLIDDAIVRADTINKPWAVDELKSLKSEIAIQRDNKVRGQVVHHNWVVNTPLEIGIADEDKAQSALQTAKNYRTRYGMYVTGIDRDENQEGSSKWKQFSYVGAVMTLPTGVQAISEARYGNPDEALDYLKRLENGFSYALPGSMYEVSPDYGMISQAWNIYAVATPIIEHLIGVKPKAFDKTVTIRPNMPSGWDEVNLNNLKVGTNSIDFAKTSTGYTLTQTQSDWTIILDTPTPQNNVFLNGQEIAKPEAGERMKINLSGASNEISFQ